jgi:hypothetical protein
MQLFYSSLFVRSAHGRSIENIKWDQVNDLIRNGAVFPNTVRVRVTGWYPTVALVLDLFGNTAPFVIKSLT